jgi:hypothetical protein
LIIRASAENRSAGDCEDPSRRIPHYGEPEPDYCRRTGRSEKAKIEKLARDHGLMNAVTPQRENSMACVSFPTCPLAMAEAERFLPSFIDKVKG